MLSTVQFMVSSSVLAPLTPSCRPETPTAATPSGVAAVDPVVRYSVSSDGSAGPAPTAARSPPSISP
jgi:hypothetical protein